MPDDKRFEPGEDATDFTLADYKYLVEGVKNLVQPAAVAPLEWADESLHVAYEPGFYARLHGPGNPYGMTELYGKAGGLWANRVRQCDACAYEVNDRPRLDGKVIWLEFGAPGEYVGQWIGVGAAHPPPACFLTVRLTDCDGGAPIEGAAVTFLRVPATAGIDPIERATDSDGEYTFTNADTNLRTHFTISWDGASTQPMPVGGPTVYNCENPLAFCYRHARVTVTTNAPAHAGFIFPQAPTVVTGDGTAEVVSVFKRIDYCSTSTTLPFAGMASAVPVDPTKYLNNCVPITVNCGDDISVSVPMFKWDDDYAVHNDCDLGCETYGEGPNYRGLAPKVLHVTPSTVVGQHLGIYEGTPITVTWDGTRWDSGCLPSSGVQCIPPYSPTYQSARLTITYGAGGLFGGTTDFFLRFTQYGLGGCGADPAGPGPVCPDKVIVAGTRCGLMAPVDSDLSGTVESQSDFSQYNFHVTE